MRIGIGATLSGPDEQAHGADNNQDAAPYDEPMPKLECLQ
jgi:hypothetical protein